MATAKQITTHAVPVNTYVLTLTESEAETLLMVCGGISGCPFQSRRRHMGEIQTALRSAGILDDFPKSQRAKEGTIVFRKGY